MLRCSFEAATAILRELVSVLAACFPLYGAAEMEPVNYGKCKHLSSFQYRRTLPCVCVCVCSLSLFLWSLSLFPVSNDAGNPLW